MTREQTRIQRVSESTFFPAREDELVGDQQEAMLFRLATGRVRTREHAVRGRPTSMELNLFQSLSPSKKIIAYSRVCHCGIPHFTSGDQGKVFAPCAFARCRVDRKDLASR